MPGAHEQSLKAELVLEININHPLAQKLRDLYESDKDTLQSFSKILYAQARLISGLDLDNPNETTNLICDLMLK